MHEGLGLNPALQKKKKRLDINNKLFGSSPLAGSFPSLSLSEIFES
jgi:hypothetical protein